MREVMLAALESQINRASTENGAVSCASTKSEVLDFFSQGGVLRNHTKKEQCSIFARAWNENPLLALKAMFYFRDVRGGQGQRNAFRNQLAYLADIAPETVRKNLTNIPFYGRWDDLYALDNTAVEDDAFTFLKDQLKIDMEKAEAQENISLLAKWMKSENASSIETKRLATKTRKSLGWSSKRYRKTLSSLRSYLDVVERKVTSGEWDSIEYSSVPSNAMMKYRNAFITHDAERFGNFILDVLSNDDSINSGTLYPHQIVGKLDSGLSPQLAQAMWDGLPNYISDAEENSIAVVDVSGSMHGTPINVAISLGIYLAERVSGPFKNRFITFSESPELQKIDGDSLATKVDGMKKLKWGFSTDIEKVFNLILSTAITYNISQEEMIDKLYIISDMEFDDATNSSSLQDRWGESGNSTAPDATLFQRIRTNFITHGYKMPNLVFWNVDARNQQFPMSMDERGFQNVSGFSPSIFKHLVGGEFVSAEDLMLEVLNSERYNAIEV